MTQFIWPSDADRAKNDELNRVCEQLETVTEERDEYHSHLAVISEMTGNGSDIGAAHEGVNAIIEQRDAALEREAALVAHMEHLRAAVEFCNEHHHFGGWTELLDGNPNTSPARRDLIKQAEAFEKQAEGEGKHLSDWLFGRAREYRQQAQNL